MSCSRATSGETLLLFGGGGSVGIIATQLAVARGVTVISAVGEHDETLARELGATPVRYGAGLALPGPRRRRARWTPCSTRPARCPGRRDRAGRRGPSGSSPCPTRPPPTSASRWSSPRSRSTGASGALDETIALLANGRRSPARAPIHAHAAGRRGPPPAGKAWTLDQRIILTLN